MTLAKLSHIQAGFNKWYTRDIATLGWKATFMSPIANLVIHNAFRKYAGTIALLQDADGNIDIEALHKDYVDIINKSGSIELFGIRFNAQDVDNLYNFIKTEIPPAVTPQGPVTTATTATTPSDIVKIKPQ